MTTGTNKKKPELSAALRANMQRRKAVGSKPGTHRPAKKKPSAKAE